MVKGAKLHQIWSHWSWLVRKANPCKTILAKVVQFSYKDGIIWITSLNIICFANSKCIWAFWQLALFYHQPRVLKYCLIILVFSNITYLQVRIVVCQSPTYLPTYLLSISIIVYTLSLSIDVGVYATICIFLCLSFGRKRSYAKHKNCFSTISWKPQKCFQTNFQSENLSDKFSNLQMSTYDARKLRKMICSILCPISNQNSPNQVQNLWEIFSRRRLGSNRPKW